jgi:hypothetical protein
VAGEPPDNHSQIRRAQTDCACAVVTANVQWPAGRSGLQGDVKRYGRELFQEPALVGDISAYAGYFSGARQSNRNGFRFTHIPPA